MFSGTLRLKSAAVELQLQSFAFGRRIFSGYLFIAKHNSREENSLVPEISKKQKKHKQFTYPVSEKFVVEELS